MSIKWLVLFCIVLNICFGDASLLLWSSKNLAVPALKRFTDKDLQDLLIKLDNPKIIAFRGSYVSEILSSLQRTQDIKYTSYIPDSDVFIENITELSGNYNDVRKQFTDTLNFAEPHSKNRLIVFQNTNAREKRETVNAPIPDQTSSEETAEGPVVYNTTEAIIYSSKPLLLRINSTTISLGRAYLVTANTGKRAMYKIIKANIKTEDGKLFLSFLFPYTDSYWWLTSIEIELPDGSKYNVTTKREIMAPKRFSYHCGGETTFADTVNAVELRFFELQVQMNVTKGRFDDAYDCVPFTTGPIWSGLFVTFILAVGLVVALGAIGSIKTMDKFDNHKTKQLSITVFE